MNTTHHHAEIELLLCCARTAIPPAAAERVRALLRRDVDWDWVMKAAREHGLTTLLYRNLNAVASEAAPAFVLERLRCQCRATAVRNSLLTDELLRLLGLLEAAHIPVVPFKGPALAAFAYGDIALRQFTDLDILVRKRDVSKATALLIAQGYVSPSLTPMQEGSLLRNGCEREFRNKARGSIVDIHWKFTDCYFSFPIVSEGLWERTARLPLGSGMVSTFSAEDLLLILCVHGTKHGWHRLAWLCDISEMIQAHPNLDWERVLAQARALHIQRALFLGLHLANALLALPLPEGVRQRVQTNPQTQALAGLVQEGLFPAENEGAGTPEDVLRAFRIQLKARDRIRDRVSLTLRRLLRPVETDPSLLRRLVCRSVLSSLPRL